MDADEALGSTYLQSLLPRKSFEDLILEKRGTSREEELKI